MWPKNVPPDIKTHHRINIGYEKSLTVLTKLIIYIYEKVGIFKIKKQEKQHIFYLGTLCPFFKFFETSVSLVLK